MKNKKSIYIITLILLVGVFVAVQNFMSKNPTLQQSTAAVHFIDVGQGDSILISSDNYNVLIDGGDNNQGETVVNYIKSQNINHLDAIIVSHPHADHIGGLDTVIKELSVEKIFMKKLPRSQTPTTKSYLDFLNAIKDKGLKITEIKSGAGFTMGNGYLTFVNSDKDFDDLNNQSAVVKFEYNSQSFLFTGDIEKQAEKAILKSDISADVLKVAHHGSNTSTTDEFLKKVNPSVAVISVGDDNKYNHPNKDTIEKLKNINVYQTNINGNICINIYDTYLDVVLAKGE